jgi:hypothetical protein
MKVKNTGQMPSRMRDLWPWVVALDAWDYGDVEPLAELVNTSEILPPEFAPVIAKIISGKRKQKRNASKLKIKPARERMSIAIQLSSRIALFNFFQFGALEGMADRQGIEPIEVKKDIQEKTRQVVKNASTDLGISTETIENLLRDFRKKINDWPSV